MTDGDPRPEATSDARSASDPAVPTQAEVDGRRLLSLDAAVAASKGLLAVGAAGSIGRSTGVSSGLVRLAGATWTGWAAASAVGAVAEDWQSPLRRAVAVNVASGAVLLGMAAARGSRRGRTGLGLASVQAGLLALAQVRTLVRAQGPIVA